MSRCIRSQQNLNWTWFKYCNWLDNDRESGMRHVAGKIEKHEKTKQEQYWVRSIFEKNGWRQSSTRDTGGVLLTGDVRPRGGWKRESNHPNGSEEKRNKLLQYQDEEIETTRQEEEEMNEIRTYWETDNKLTGRSVDGLKGKKTWRDKKMKNTWAGEARHFADAPSWLCIRTQTTRDKNRQQWWWGCRYDGDEDDEADRLDDDECKRRCLDGES